MDFVLIAQRVSRTSTDLSDAIEVGADVVVTAAGLHLRHEALEGKRL